jgi:hypothetical protein
MCCLSSTGLATPVRSAAKHGCAGLYTRADLVDAARREYRRANARLRHPKLRHMRACAYSPAARAWMLDYQHRLWKRWEQRRQVARWWRDCADAPTWRVFACIRYAAWRYHQDADMMIRVAHCESGWRPHIAGAHQGMWQYLWSTWRSLPWRNRSPYSARWSSLATAYAWSIGRKGEWECR